MRKLAIVVALSSTVLATPALARNGAWYVGGDFGAMIVEDIGFDFGLGADHSERGDAQIAINHEYGFDGALFVGYDLGAFRIEAEVAYKRARVDDIETRSVARFPEPGTASAAGASRPDIFTAGGGRTSALSFMINGMLDFGDDDGISGFVGGGVGMARVDYNNIRAFSNSGRDRRRFRHALRVAGRRRRPSGDQRQYRHDGSLSLLQRRQYPDGGLPRLRIEFAVPVAQLARRHHLQLRRPRDRRRRPAGTAR